MVSNKAEANNLEPNENISRKEFHEKVRRGSQRTHAHNSILRSRAEKTDCTTNAHTP